MKPKLFESIMFNSILDCQLSPNSSRALWIRYMARLCSTTSVNNLIAFNPFNQNNTQCSNYNSNYTIVYCPLDIVRAAWLHPQAVEGQDITSRVLHSNHHRCSIYLSCLIFKDEIFCGSLILWTIDSIKNTTHFEYEKDPHMYSTCIWFAYQLPLLILSCLRWAHLICPFYALHRDPART